MSPHLWNLLSPTILFIVTLRVKPLFFIKLNKPKFYDQDTLLFYSNFCFTD